MLFVLLIITNTWAKTDNYLRHTSLVDNQLNLRFKYALGDIKNFTLRHNGIYKHVYDIKNGVLPPNKNLSQYKTPAVKVFRIGQYSKTVLRVVIESKFRLKQAHTLKKNTLTLHLPSYKNMSNKNNAVNNKVVTKHYNYRRARQYKTIILDAGHGGRDVGASGKGIREKNLTLSMTHKLKNVLKKMGYRVLMTRTKDKTMSLKARTEFANKYKGSLFVSVHANAAPRKRNPKVSYEGIEIFYLLTKNSKRVKNKRAVYRGKKIYTKNAYKKMISKWKIKESKKAAKQIRKNILHNVQKKYVIRDKGVKRNDFWVLLATQMPSVLVEMGYLTNKRELKKLKKQEYQDLLVEGIAKGINAYFKL